MERGSFGQPCISGHTVMIHDRGGQKRIDQLIDITRVKWGRMLDGQPIAEIEIAGRRECKAQLQKLLGIRSRRHELVIFRGLDRVFEGPILRVKWLSNRVIVLAKDVSEYLRGTSMSKDWPGPAEGGRPLMTDRIDDIIRYELTEEYQMRIGTGSAGHLVTVPRWETIDTPANILPHLEVRHSETLRTTSSVLAFEMNVMEHLEDLSRGTLNFTTLGRKILIWDSDQLLGKTRRLTDADFYGEIEVYENGTDYSDIVHVSAQRDEEDVVVTDPGVTQGVGHDGEADDYYGVWEYISSMQSEEGEEAPTSDALNSQAQRVERIRGTMPLEMKIPASSGLRLSHDLTIMDLVPGVVMPVAATFNLREVSQDQMLSAMQVEETPNNELIQITLIPAGVLSEVSS